LSVAELAVRALSFVVGLAIVIMTLLNAIETFVLPRSANAVITRFVFRAVVLVFRLRLHGARTYEGRDRVMAFYAPISLVLLPAVMLVCILVGYTLMFSAINGGLWYGGFKASEMSLLTLGFVNPDSFPANILEFTEGVIGLILIALLIGFLPTLYGIFSRREAAVNLLEVRAGSPPSALEMLTRVHRIRGLSYLTEVWTSWEVWFAELEESHTSLASVVFFRSPQPGRSWVTAAGAILDAASIAASTLDLPRNPQAELTIRAGYLALRRICDFFNIKYDDHPNPGDPISIAQQEYDAVYDALAQAGLPMKQDREQAWRDFAGWRVNYDRPLLALAALTIAPYAPWSSDRSLPRWEKYRNDRRMPLLRK
jgi:hypothetical protein